MSNLNKPDNWVEQYFAGCVNFGRKSTGSICHNGLGFDQIIFKIDLPKELTICDYKDSFIVYDLINSIEIDIGGQNIISLCSKQLEMLDKVNRNFENIRNCASIIDGAILYPLDLKYFFGKSRSTDPNLTGVLPLDFGGIRLVDLDMHEVRVYLKLNTVDKIIDSTTCQLTTEELDKLCIYDASMLVHYVKIHDQNLGCYATTINDVLENTVPENTQDDNYYSWLTRSLSYFTKSDPKQIMCHKILNTVKNPKLYQNLCTWFYDFFELTNKDIPISQFKYKLCPPKGNTTKIIIHSKELNKVKHFQLQLDGYNYMNKMELNHYKKLYEYNNNITLGDNIFVLDVHIPQNMDTVILCVWLDEPSNNFKMDIMHNDNIESMYNDGIFHLQVI